MGEIKTALEIALEKTGGVKSDKAGISQFEVKKRGKKLANAFLEGEIDLAAEIKKTPAQDRESLKQGIFDVLVTKIALPSAKEDEIRIEKLGKGLSLVIKSGEFNEMYRQLTCFLPNTFKKPRNLNKWSSNNTLQNFVRKKKNYRADLAGKFTLILSKTLNLSLFITSK